MSRHEATVTAPDLTVESRPGADRGLDEEQARRRLARGQGNRAAQPTSRSAWAIVRGNVVTRFSLLLGTLCAVVLAVGPPQDALFGLVVIFNSTARTDARPVRSAPC